MDLITFNSKYLPPAFGFHNLGATCYFNALVQSLLSCTSLTELFIKNRKNPKFIKNPVIMVYISMIDLFYQNGQHINKQALARKNPELWCAMINFLKQQNKHGYFGRGQEDSYEAFVMLMHCWEDIDEIHTLFEHTYHNNYLCLDCRRNRFTFEHMKNKDYDNIKTNWKNKSQKIESGELEYKHENDESGWIMSNTHFITTHDFTTEQDDVIKSKYNIREPGDLQEYLMCQKSILEGLMCVHCDSKCNKLSYSTLAVIPEILVIVIKKYKFDRNRRNSTKLNVATQLPKKIEIDKDSGGKLTYYPVSQIMHSGGVGGGHYWAHTIRLTGKSIRWYDLNDTSVSPLSNIQSFVSNSNTYTVLYHLI